jgi:nucleotide-binding universal stress UspA family protein
VAKPDTNPTVTFNVFDRCGALLAPEMVQKMAKAHNIVVGTKVLANIDGASWSEYTSQLKLASSTAEGFALPPDASLHELTVVTATVALFSNFADVYKLWAFVAKFLDPRFCEQFEGHKRQTTSMRRQNNTT